MRREPVVKIVNRSATIGKFLTMKYTECTALVEQLVFFLCLSSNPTGEVMLMLASISMGWTTLWGNPGTPTAPSLMGLKFDVFMHKRRGARKYFPDSDCFLNRRHRTYKKHVNKFNLSGVTATVVRCLTLSLRVRFMYPVRRCQTSH